MNKRDIDSVDFRLKFLAGKPIAIDDVGELKPYTLQEISEVGYMKYNSLLNSLIVDVRKLFPDFEFSDKSTEVSMFDLIPLIQEESFRNNFIDAIKLFFREDATLIKFPKEGEEVYIIVLGDISSSSRIVHRENFLLIREILRVQNGIKAEPNEVDYNPADEAAKELANRLAEMRKKVEAQKSKRDSSDTEIDIVDIVSAVAGFSNNVDIKSVWDLTLYQLYDHYKRLETINQYRVSLEALMNGAKDVDIQHWSSKLS